MSSQAKVDVDVKVEAAQKRQCLIEQLRGLPEISEEDFDRFVGLIKLVLKFLGVIREA